MKFDNYELSTIHYTIGYYIDNANLDEDENEWLNPVSYTHLTLPTSVTV